MESANEETQAQAQQQPLEAHLDPSEATDHGQASSESTEAIKSQKSHLTQEQLWEILQNASQLIFTGNAVHTTVEIEQFNYPQLRSLKTDTEVQLIPDLWHSALLGL